MANLLYTRKTPPLPGSSKWYTLLKVAFLSGLLFNLWNKHLSDFSCPSRKPDSRHPKANCSFFLSGRLSCPSPTQPLGKNCQNNGQPHTDTPKAHFQCLWPLTLLNIPRLWSTYETTSGGQLATCSTQETNALKIGVETHASPICRAYALC